MPRVKITGTLCAILVIGRPRKAAIRAIPPGRAGCVWGAVLRSASAELLFPQTAYPNILLPLPQPPHARGVPRNLTPHNLPAHINPGEIHRPLLKFGKGVARKIRPRQGRGGVGQPKAPHSQNHQTKNCNSREISQFHIPLSSRPTTVAKSRLKPAAGYPPDR